MILSPKRSRWILGADACACACARLSFYRVGQVYDPHDTGFVDTEVLVLLCGSLRARSHCRYAVSFATGERWHLAAPPARPPIAADWPASEHAN